MGEYITNLVNVSFDKSVIEVYRISGKANLGLLTNVINKYAKDLVASFLPTDYGKLRAGVYVAAMGVYLSKEEIEIRIKEALEEYRRMRNAQGLPVDDTLDISNITLELVPDIPPTAYVVANLLNNALSKAVAGKLRCPRRPGEGFAICLDIDLLEREFWQLKIVDEDEILIDFCKEYPSLCRDTGDSCSRFFKVVKCIAMRFQHVISDREEIYVVLHHYYRRLGNLDLKIIIDHMRINHINLDALQGIYVNYRDNKDTTLICKIVLINSNKLTLACEEQNISLDISSLDKVHIAINPNYSQSRKFISEYLCKEFDKHRELNRLYPHRYFSILENDLEIVRRIIDKLCIGKVCFSINKRLKRIMR
ncbi:MAG: hypothetical protein QXP97_07630 [Desulfurococcus sp.]|uniref:hypothetical protein n=1 Tax=Desulfurococcus sp. TaxID=51678 RepID=UPI0031613E26